MTETMTGMGIHNHPTNKRSEPVQVDHCTHRCANRRAFIVVPITDSPYNFRFSVSQKLARHRHQYRFLTREVAVKRADANSGARRAERL